MGDRGTVERMIREVRPPELTLERFQLRRERRRRVQQTTTAVFVLALFGALAAITARAILVERTEPADDGLSIDRGVITLPTGEVVEPSSGRRLGSLAIPGATDLSWSPEGSSLAYATASGVYILDVPTGTDRQVFPCGLGHHWDCTIAWSPYGTTIAVGRANRLVLVRTNGTRATTVRSFEAGRVVSSPTWSPDGVRISFLLSDGLAGSRDVYTIRRDGSALTRIVRGTAGSLGPWSPSWSPDGTRIAYIDAAPWGAGQWSLHVRAVSPDGSDTITLLDVGRCYCLGLIPAGAWSPDGTRLALVVPGVGHALGTGGNLYVADAAAGDPALVETDVVGPPAWRPVLKAARANNP